MTIKARVEVKGIEEFINNTSRDIAEEIYERSQRNIESMDVIASGFLKRSGIVMRIDDDTWIVKYTAPYAVFVEFGTRSHRPPVKPLVEWAMLKFGIPYNKAKSIAYRVANKVAQYGTEPRPFLRNAIDSVLNDIRLGRVRVREMNLEFKGETNTKQYKRWNINRRRLVEKKLKEIEGGG